MLAIKAASPGRPPPHSNGNADSDSSMFTRGQKADVTSARSVGVNTNLTARRGGQDVVGIHGAQLVPAAVPPRLTLDADDLVNPFQAVHAHRVQVHESPCAQRHNAEGGHQRNPLLSPKGVKNWCIYQL